ncbi:MAG: hypothetical protein CMJ83_16320 [Planctomycetes bacterium]|jgi:RNA polymerase sigma-70 factor (ECF subfamily)|nr:hypothetical protein [Planctomycetota bacterium]
MRAAFQISDPSAAAARESSLLARARAGEDSAFCDLITPCMHRLRSLVRPMTRDLAEAEDIVQEAVLRAWRHLDRFREGRFTTWFFRIGINQAISGVRRRARLQRLLTDLARPSDEAVADPLIADEDHRRLRIAVSALPERSRGVLELRYRQGLEVKEIAARLGTTPNAISLLLFKARRRLRASIA